MRVTYNHIEIYDNTDFYIQLFYYTFQLPALLLFYSYHVNETINIMQWIVDCSLSLSFNIILLVEYNTFWFYIKWILPFLLYFTSSTGRGWENTQKKSAIQVSYINYFEL